jgi:hypothetical protein
LTTAAVGAESSTALSDGGTACTVVSDDGDEEHPVP